MKLGLLAALTASLALPAVTAISLQPVADTYIRIEEPERNFGAAEKLEVTATNESVALFRFDLTTLPLTAVVSSAHLDLTFDAPAARAQDSRFIVCDLNRDFQESEATYRISARNQPWAAPGLLPGRDYGADDRFYCSPPVHVSGPGPGSADVSKLVRMAMSAHRKAVNFVLLSMAGGATGSSVYSRRSANAANRPKLTVSFNPNAPWAIVNHPFLETKFAPVIIDASSSTQSNGKKGGLLYSWTVDQPAPGSTYSPGQELGHQNQLKFEPDVPGLWNIRLRVTDGATREFSETTVAVTDIQLGAHPRLGFNPAFLSELQAMRAAKRPEWTRFEAWLKKPEDPGYGHIGQGLLLGYVITKDKTYFNAAWKIYAPKLYIDGISRQKGLRPMFGPCGTSDTCEEHIAGTEGAYLTLEIAYLYDWAFDALSTAQRQDIIDWLYDANQSNHLKNNYAEMHFRNDAVAITAALGATAYAIYGENRRAMQLMTWFRQEWGHTLEAMDILAKGGALGEGNAYGETSAALLIHLANLVYYASGENLFLSHPYFRRHLAYEAFSTYPNRLREADDPIYHSDPPQPIPEGASLGGDDNRGYSWHSVHLRPNGLALARRFPNTEEAEVWNWVFRQKDIFPDENAWADVFFYSAPPPLVKPKRLSFLDPSMGYVYIRSDWDSRDATWISSWGGPHADTHEHLDQGSFTLFKRRDLAAKTGNYDNNPTFPHFMSYYTRTVSSNNILIGDPNEYYSAFIGYWGCDGQREHDLFQPPDGSAKVCIPNDGGQRTMAPYSIALADNDTYFSHRQIYDVAQITSFADNGQAVSWVYDITNAYNNPLYTTPHNEPKVTKVYRKFVYLRQPDVLLVADTVDSTNPAFEKSWLIHAIDRIEVGGQVKDVSPGESIHTGTDKARIIVDDKDPSNTHEITADLRTGYAALQIRTLYPTNFHYRLIGGREPGRHIKDFWVKDYSEGVQPDHRSLNWFPVNPQEAQNPAKVPTFGGGYGRWRLEVQPTAPSKNDYFLNVLKPTLQPAGDMPELTKFETPEQFGASFVSGGKTYKVTFTKETLDPGVVEGMDLRAPVISQPKPASPLPGGTRQTMVTVTTDEPASCRFSYRPGVTYPFMTTNFDSKDGLTHSILNRELNNGDTYTYYVRCVDQAGNENLDDYRLSFSVGH